MKRKILVMLLVLIMAVSLLSGCGGSGATDETADTVIVGSIYTADSAESTVQAVAIKDGVYVYAGDEEGVQQYIGDKTEVITLEEGMVMPSFMEGHAHGHQGGVGYLFEVNLYEDASLAEYQDTVRQFIKDNPELTFINGGGWINGYFPASGPTTAMLDEVSTEIPIVLVSGDHHSYWVNSKAMELTGANADTPDIAGGVIERDPATKEPTGTFREKANTIAESIIPEYSVEQYKQGILAYQEEAKSYGITAYYEPMVNLAGGPNLLEAYNQLDKDGELLIRVFGGYLVTADNDPLGELDKCREIMDGAEGGDFTVNSIKLLIDGVVEGKTAYMLEDYSDQAGFKGEALWEQELLNQVCIKADELGIQLHSHAIGDAAVRMTVDAYQAVADKNGGKDNRAAITHLQIVAPEEIQRMADLNVIASANPYWFCKEPGYFYELEVPYLGEARANSEYPMKSFFDKGIVVVSASDFPVTMPAMPLSAIQTGVTRCDRAGDPATLQNPDERVTVKQMIAASTINGAYENYAEDVFGSVEVGKSADLIILDKNILEIDPFEIAQTNVKTTMLKGQVIFSAE